ncbi:ComEA family DNA-binding protein [Salinicola corii]|uniref:ComEA family DNA-binding protein n=1 Tax=Salinicola corii TaxID=2606937 RepID=A0A640WK50_9GAMM|nr:ComEA family DNA-binding protein [Salinicola corii]KAA0020921.1 ComEA family DNA-binding protein [Salinicola corii]
MKTLIHAALFSLLSFTTLPVLAQDTPVNINEASVEILTTLPGIGAVKAQAIVDDRKANGDYKSLEDLTRVDGIGEATVANLSENATL